MRTIAVLLALGAVAHAQTPDDKARAEAIYHDGQRAYADSNYAIAADRFKAAWRIDPDPAYLFNIAQALRGAKRCSESASYYHRFLDQVAAAPNLDKVHGYLAEVEACARAEVVAAPPPPESHALRRAGIGVGLGGLVAIGVGAGFAWHAHALQSDREHVCDSPCVWTDDIAARAAKLDRDGPRAQTIGFVAMGIGAAALAAGAVMYWLGAPAEHVEVAPTANGAVISATLRF